jgi:hypothetical protein
MSNPIGIIGIFINLNKTNFKLYNKTDELVIDKCDHYTDKMKDCKFCPECGFKLHQKIIVKDVSSIVPGFERANYIFNDNNYRITMNKWSPDEATIYIIHVLDICNQSVDKYIKALNIALDISKKLDKYSVPNTAGIYENDD